MWCRRGGSGIDYLTVFGGYGVMMTLRACWVRLPIASVCLLAARDTLALVLRSVDQCRPSTENGELSGANREVTLKLFIVLSGTVPSIHFTPSASLSRSRRVSSMQSTHTRKVRGPGTVQFHDRSPRWTVHSHTAHGWSTRRFTSRCDGVLRHSASSIARAGAS